MSIVLFLLGLIVIYLIARWNKSVKLLIFLLIAYLGGIVGGCIIAHLSSSRKDTTSYTVIKKAVPTQSTVYFCNSTANVITESNTVSLSGAESFGYPTLFITRKQCSISKYPQNRGTPTKFFNTS